MIISVSCGEPATHLNGAVAGSLCCMVLRLSRLNGQEDGAWCRPDLKHTAAFLRRESWKRTRVISQCVREKAARYLPQEKI